MPCRTNALSTRFNSDEAPKQTRRVVTGRAKMSVRPVPIG
jgi:hypothetical protein